MGCGCSTAAHVDLPRDQGRTGQNDEYDVSEVVIATTTTTAEKGNVDPASVPSRYRTPAHSAAQTPTTSDPASAEKHPRPNPALAPATTANTHTNNNNAVACSGTASPRARSGSRRYLVGVPVTVQEHTPDMNTDSPTDTQFVQSALGVTYPYDVSLDTDVRPCWNSMLPTPHPKEPIHLHADRRAAAGIRTTPDAKKAPSATELFLRIPITESGALEHYDVVGVLGKGTFGEVKEIQHKVTLRKYALKTINYSQAKISSIAREWNVLEFVGRHPFIIGYFETYRTAERVDFVFEIAEGGDLHTRLAYAGPLDERTARIAFRGLAQALQYLHRRGVIHRDLKPENILVTQHGYNQLHCTCGAGRESPNSVFFPAPDVDAIDENGNTGINDNALSGNAPGTTCGEPTPLPPPNSKVNKHLAYVVKMRKNTSLLSLKKTDRMPTPPLFSPEACGYRSRANSQFMHKYTCPVYLATDCRGFDDSDFLVLKISDFGLSQIIGNNERLLKVAGTWTFAAPEMKDPKKQGYSTLFDCWSFGVILYTALAASHPFDPNATLTTSEIHTRIMSGQYDFLDPVWRNVSPAAKDLITKLLVIPQERRLNTEGIMHHPWISGVVNPYTHRWQVSQKLYLRNHERLLQQQKVEEELSAAEAVKMLPVPGVEREDIGKGETVPVVASGTATPKQVSGLEEKDVGKEGGEEEEGGEVVDTSRQQVQRPLVRAWASGKAEDGPIQTQSIPTGEKQQPSDAAAVKFQPSGEVVPISLHLRATAQEDSQAYGNTQAKEQYMVEPYDGDMYNAAELDNNPAEVVHSNPASPYRIQLLVSEQGYDAPETSRLSPAYEAFAHKHDNAPDTAGVPSPTPVPTPPPPAIPTNMTATARSYALPSVNTANIAGNNTNNTDDTAIDTTVIPMVTGTRIPPGTPGSPAGNTLTNIRTPGTASPTKPGGSISPYNSSTRYSSLERAFSEAPPEESTVMQPASPLMKARPMYSIDSDEHIESRMGGDARQTLQQEPIPKEIAVAEAAGRSEYPES